MRVTVGDFEERGQAHLPNPELINLVRLIDLERLSRNELGINFDQLRVRKVGLPPLFKRLLPRSSNGYLPPLFKLLDWVVPEVILGWRFEAAVSSGQRI